MCCPHGAGGGVGQVIDRCITAAMCTLFVPAQIYPLQLTPSLLDGVCNNYGVIEVWHETPGTASEDQVRLTVCIKTVYVCLIHTPLKTACVCVCVIHTSIKTACVRDPHSNQDCMCVCDPHSNQDCTCVHTPTKTACELRRLQRQGKETNLRALFSIFIA